MGVFLGDARPFVETFLVVADHPELGRFYVDTTPSTGAPFLCHGIGLCCPRKGVGRAKKLLESAMSMDLMFMYLPWFSMFRNIWPRKEFTFKIIHHGFERVY